MNRTLPSKHVEECLRILRRAKAYLWHGSPHRALQTLEDLTWEIGTESEHAKVMQDKLEEFMGYVTANLTAIPNYADRHRHGEPTSCCKSEPACSISSCAVISSAGTRGSNQFQPQSGRRRSTQNGPLSRDGRVRPVSDAILPFRGRKFAGAHQQHKADPTGSARQRCELHE